MTKRVERRPIESVTASVASRPKVCEAEATSHVWSMSLHAEAVSGVVALATTTKDVAIAKAMTVAWAAQAPHVTGCLRYMIIYLR